MIRPDEGVEETVEATMGDTEEGKSAVEGTDAGLAGTLFKTAVERDCGGRLAVNNSDHRRGGTVNIRDCLEWHQCCRRRREKAFRRRWHNLGVRKKRWRREEPCSGRWGRQETQLSQRRWRSVKQDRGTHRTVVEVRS